MNQQTIIIKDEVDEFVLHRKKGKEKQSGLN